MGEFSLNIGLFCKARMSESGEIVVLCDDCRKKQSGFEYPPQATE